MRRSRYSVVVRAARRTRSSASTALAVGAAAAVRDPGARAGAHHRLDRRHQAAGGPLDDRCRRRCARGCRARGSRPRSPGRRAAACAAARAGDRGSTPPPAPALRRYSSSRSRSRARSSVGQRLQFAGGGSIGRIRPSPRRMARMPDTQPRQLSCATTTVTSAITRPSTAMNMIRYWRVSWLRRSMKLKSCSSTRLGGGARLVPDCVQHAHVHGARRQAPAAARASAPPAPAPAGERRRKARRCSQQHAFVVASTGRWRPGARRAPRARQGLQALASSRR